MTMVGRFLPIWRFHLTHRNLLIMIIMAICMGCALLWTSFAMLPTAAVLENYDALFESKTNIQNQIFRGDVAEINRNSTIKQTKVVILHRISQMTSKYVAVVNTKEELHLITSQVSSNISSKIVTTAKLTEEYKLTTTPAVITTQQIGPPLCYILLWVENGKPVDLERPVEGTRLPGNCKITYNQKMLKSANIVVFHQSILKNVQPWKQYRNSRQRYVWWSNDNNPYHIKYVLKQNLTEYDGFFNWTMTHRRDSDVYFPLWRKSSLYNNVVGGKADVDKEIAKKEKSTVWIANGCNLTTGNKQRMRLAVKLVQAKLKVDYFGDCFRLKADELKSAELAKYRFYLSFIDSVNCIDYITDQLWKPLRAGLIPIVFGPTYDDVINAAPCNSFIHVSKFDSPKGLVNYLNYLEVNATAYREYFRWREIHNLDLDDRLIASLYPQVKLIRHTDASGWSRLCEKYREAEDEGSTSVIGSLSKFVFENERKECMPRKPS